MSPEGIVGGEPAAAGASRQRADGPSPGGLVARAAAAYVAVAERLRLWHETIFRLHYGRRFQACGADPEFFPLSSTIAYEHVRLGSRVYIGPRAIIGRAHLGDDVMLGPNVSIRDGYHRHDLVGRAIRESGGTAPGLVVVGDDVWIGEGAVLLRGARVGDGSVIGTKAMVTGPIPPYCVAVGSPARPVRRRFEDDELREHLRLRGVPAERAEALVAERARALADIPVERST